jgi:hypothetical protein
LCAGSKGGKTSWGPWKLWQWIQRYGGGDYYAVTSTYDLFHVKLLPTIRQVFENILGIARYWSQKRVLELRDPATGDFLANKADDLMWGRIILRAAEARGGLEAGDAKGVWMDEAGMDSFTKLTYRALRRRAALYQAPFLLTTTLYDLGWIDSEIIAKAKSDQESTIKIETIDIGDGDSAEIEFTHAPGAGIDLIQFDSTVNPLYPKAEFIEAREELPDEDFQAFHRGRRGSSRLLVYDTFNPKSIEDGGHVCTPFEIPGNWDRFWGLDFGPVNTACMLYAEDPKSAEKPEDRTLYCYREYLAGNKTIEQHYIDIMEGEHISPRKVVGGTWGSEEQWRREFRQYGLPIERPRVREFDSGIQSVYAQHKKGRIVYFRGLQIIGDKQRYRRKRDREGEILPEIQSKQSYHRCFVAGTMIQTDRGEIPIEQVKVGDRALTREGLRPVLLVGSRENEHVVEVTFSDGNSLVGTFDHPIWVDGRGFVAIDAMRYNDVILRKENNQWLKQKESSSMVSPTLAIQNRIGYRINVISRRVKMAPCIGRFGSFIMDLFRRVWIFITKTVGMITQLKTLSFSREKSIKQNTQRLMKECLSTWKKYDHLPRNGMHPRRGKSGIESTAKELMLRWSLYLKNARIAVVNSISERLTNLSPAFALMHARQLCVSRAESMILNSSAKSAGWFSSQTNMSREGIAPVSVLGKRTAGKGTVYNLSVEDVHEYYANGVLVSNCDAERYIVLTIRPGRKKTGRAVAW